ncbi:putative serine/threonine-protein kinase pix13 [Quercus suber]|uniref:non-specific serine/threonine protein kinase n=1 Tax=Quercus suber TaxID=58331 RepID=A0AAW0LQB6_QUESU
MDESYPDGKILETPNLKEFTSTDLKTATKNFKSDFVLGEGGFGKVFRGWVDEKTLAPSKAVNFLGRLSHPNLVRLLGYCWEDKQLLLVYEFMSKGSLENHLFRRNPNIELLSWDIRLKILIGAARGLAFLHTSEKKVIYKDFKALNILLDGNYKAKISDFGLAKLGPSGGDSHVTAKVMGTYGYAAPEYIATGDLYVKSDVYGFGVVLLEMLTGLLALDTKRPSGQQNLVEWLKPSLSSKRKLKSIMDIRMEGQYSTKATLQAGQLTLKCLESDPKSRPAMKEVVEELEGLEAMKEKPKDCKTKCTHSTPHHHSQHPIHHRFSFFNFIVTSSSKITQFPRTRSSNCRSQFSVGASKIRMDDSYPDGKILEALNLKGFSFTDLKTATKNFKPDSVLGEGGFGKVFKGWVDEKTLAPSNSCTGMAVAIKKWNPESMQGFQEWKSEVYFLGRLSHPNLIRLLGYCQEDKELLLVYEFMSKGSLDNHLFRTTKIKTEGVFLVEQGTLTMNCFLGT